MPESTRSSSDSLPLWVVILAGGIGSRFWPVSTASRPKQLLPLGGERSLVRETLDRIRPAVEPSRIRILAGQPLGRRMLRDLPELDGENLWDEPRARGTAPVLARAAYEIARAEPEAVMVSLHADHAIAPAELFREQIVEIARLSHERRRLFTIGVPPTRPETGYGYIQVGERLGPALEAYEVADFVEKPDRDTAREYLRRGGYLWNSGLFVWRVDVFLEQLRLHTPEIADLLPLLDQGRVEEYFEQAPTLSVDEGVLERSDRVAVAPARFGWDDVGAWDAVARTRTADAQGNVAVGDALMRDARDCITWSEDGTVVVFGARDLVVVHLPSVTLVLPRARAAELKELVSGLPEELRDPLAGGALDEGAAADGQGERPEPEPGP